MDDGGHGADAGRVHGAGESYEGMFPSWCMDKVGCALREVRDVFGAAVKGFEAAHEAGECAPVGFELGRYCDLCNRLVSCQYDAGLGEVQGEDDKGVFRAWVREV